jgi:predicted nuclease of predicted toxin-antitoxin system
MRVLIDECAPKELQRFLVENGFGCSTTQEAGWGGKENGELLALANREFDAFITLDRKLRFSAKSERAADRDYCLARSIQPY